MISVATPRTEILTMPWPPSANNSKFWRNGKMVSTNELRGYHTMTVMRFKGKIKTMTPPYKVRMDIYEPDRRRRDIANLEKAISDSLVKACVIEDDCKINEMTLVRHPDELCKPDGKIVVTITEVTG